MQLVKSIAALYIFAFTLGCVSTRYVLIMVKSNVMETNTSNFKANGKKIFRPCNVCLDLRCDNFEIFHFNKIN